MTVVQYEAPPPLPASLPGQELEQGPVGWVAKLRAAAEMAAFIAPTDFVPAGLRDNPAAIAAAILYGDEVGLTPMQALAKIAVIRGRPTLTAEAQRGLVTSRGHELWFEESTSTRAIAAGRRAGEERIGRITWTLDDAKRAGIVGGENWRRYPAEMLRARASAALARAMFADVLGGMPAAEELEDEPGNGAPVVDAPLPAAPADVPTPTPPGRTRRRRTTTAREPVAPTPPPDPQPEPKLPPSPTSEELVATGAQKRQIFALMRDIGMPNDDRDARLAYTIKVIGRDIATSNELTIREAGLVIDDLTKIAANRPPPEPAPTTETTVAQRGTLFGLFAEHAIDTHDDRLAYLERIVGRAIGSAAELTPAEADQAIAALRSEPDPEPDPEREQAVIDELAQHAQPADDIPF